jgi:hypothetical protein
MAQQQCRADQAPEPHHAEQWHRNEHERRRTVIRDCAVGRAGDRNRDPEHNHEHGEAGAHDPQYPVRSDAPRDDEHRLSHEQEHPSAEGGAVPMQQPHHLEAWQRDRRKRTGGSVAAGPLRRD